MSNMSTLHEIAIKLAQKQPGMADDLTEDAPILKICKFKPASHKMWNVSEKLVEISGPAFVEHDAPLPVMKTSTELVTTYLHTLGGMMQVPTQRALKFGGPQKYFAEKQPAILRHAGMTTEKTLVMDNWLKAAIASGNVKDAGGAGEGWFILAVRFDDLTNVGLYDPDQFQSGTLLKMDWLDNGGEHQFHNGPHAGMTGYTIVYRGNFGWQILEAGRTCSAIVNVNEKSGVSVDDIDNMLADIRAQSGSTYIFCSPRAKIYGINKHKKDNVQLVNNDTEAKTVIDAWNGIPIVTSYNIMDKIAHVAV